MSVWREVQEALYGRWADQWADRTPYKFENESLDPPDAPWAWLRIVSAPGQQGSLGPPGARRWDRVGRLFVLLREPPGNGVGSLSDLAEQARPIFEGVRLDPHDVRVGVLDIGGEAQVDEGRWWGVTLSGRFDYEERR